MKTTHRPKSLIAGEQIVSILFARTSGGWDEAALIAGLTLPDLTHALWTLDPDQWCVTGYRNHMDVNKVQVLLSHRRGPIRRTGRQWIERAGKNRVRLTPDGLEMGRKLSEGE